MKQKSRPFTNIVIPALDRSVLKRQLTLSPVPIAIGIAKIAPYLPCHRDSFSAKVPGLVAGWLRQITQPTFITGLLAKITLSTMIRTILTIALSIGLSFSCFPQSAKNYLVGSWVKIKTTTLEGKDTCGNFGLSDDYLRISFSKRNITFSRTPWDRGDVIPYTIDHDTIITPMHKLNYAFQESYYYPEIIDSTNLILKTTFKGRLIRYYLKNQRTFLPQLIDNQFYFDNDTIIIVRTPSPIIHYSTEPYSNATASERFFTLRPIFNSNMFFKEYICYNLYFDNKLEKDKYSKPIKVSFVIDYKGNVSQVHLIESLNEFYDKQIIKLIKKTNKKWIPMIIDTPNHSVKATFTFLIVDRSAR